MEGETNQVSPLFSDYVYQWLECALDYGISEADFWEMSIAELERAVRSRRRNEKARAQEKASFDYILADLVGKSIARIYSSSNNIPEIAEVYPSLFDTQEVAEKKQEKKMELSALRFKQFAQSYNNRFNKVVAKEE
jgi:hypothetical protein